MSTNFEVLKGDWPYLYKLASLAEDYLYTDPQSTVAKIRLLAESYTDAIASMENITFPYDENKQINKLRYLERAEILEEGKVLSTFHSIRKEGNKAVHGIYNDTDMALNMLVSAHYLTNWFVEVYGNYDLDTNPNFINPVKIVEKSEEPSESDKNNFTKSLDKLQKISSSLSPEDLQRESNIRRRKIRKDS